MNKTIRIFTPLVVSGLLLLLLVGCGPPRATIPATPEGPTPTPLPTAGPVETGEAGLPWWNDRVFYEVFVRSFNDSDGDGIGDLRGLIDRLDYLNDGDPLTSDDLGVTGMWLMPVAESPSYHGYDVVDYRTIERDYGTNEDFKTLIDEAHQRGMAVIVDLVMNHTSSEHPWFIEGSDPQSEYHDWYIWSDWKPMYNGPWGQPVWHKSDGQFYYGIFWEGMPDLNYNNPDVTEEMYDIIRFWLEDMGVDGFRLDAIRHLIEDGRIQENTPATHAWLEDFHDYVHMISPDALMVGEIWDESEEVVEYIGDEVNIAFEFELAEAIIQGVNRGNRATIDKAQETILALYPEGQYAVFLTNHDQIRVLNQLRNNEAAAKAAATLLLTNAGVPFLYYGEEIGMLGLKPDELIRTPMQWDDTPDNAGFTSGTPWEALSMGYEDHNVSDELDDPDSLLSHYRNLIHLRNQHPALRVGDLLIVQSDEAAVYAIVRHTGEETLLVIVNLSGEPVSGYQLRLDAGPLAGVLSATLLMGEGSVTAPEVNADGGFEGYTPLAALPGYGAVIIQLSP